MLRAVIRNRLGAAERDLGESMDYARFIVDASIPTFLRFAKLLGVSECRSAAPAADWHVARIVAARHEDCGPCVRIEERAAAKAGVEREIVVAARDGRFSDLPDDLAEVAEFARAVVGSHEDGDAPRENIRARIGDRALAELALGIAAAGAFPRIKRALGFASACETPAAD